MAPLILEGETLGQKQRHYNILVNDALKENTDKKPDDINYEDPDIENLFKIDIASHQKNVEYILKVLKSEDMLYVSRAIKQSSWLITDPLYADIINPHYLHNELFPQMTSKARNKFMLHIRLFLKDETRVEEFFNFLKNDDLKLALKWLPNCSISFTEEIVKTHATDISTPLIKRLCEKSITFLDIYCQNTMYYEKSSAMRSATFFLHTDLVKYLGILEKNKCAFHFGPKATKLVMNKCPQIILDKLETYLDYIDIKVFAEHLKKDDIQDFILKNIKNPKLKILFTFGNIQYFLKRLPLETKFDFVKQNFIDKTNKIDEIDDCHEDNTVAYCCTRNSQASSKLYQWYKLAPFNVAMTDLQKFLRIESNPSERLAILCIILNSAGRKMENIQKIIKFYWENHINEPFKFKIQFVNLVISKTNTHRYDTKTWGYLNDLFTSMEVYEESTNNVQACIKSIILYDVTRNENVPKIIEKKFEFETFKSTQKILDEDEKEKLFNYLYTYLRSKYDKCDTSSERGRTQAVLNLQNSLLLLMDWTRGLSDYQDIVKNIKELFQIKNNNTNTAYKNNNTEELLQLYNMSKTCKRLLFKESILLNPSVEVCINALKHDPQLLQIHKKEIEHIYLSDAVILKRLISKVRIYWPQTLAQDLKLLYLDKIKHNTNHKAVVLGICLLLPIKDVLELIHKYAPSTDKIDWSQTNDTELAIRRNIAKRLYLARPQPSLAAALLYAKGDYLQYALPSLNALLYNINSTQASEEIKILLHAPVSLQKHGIRVVSTKFKCDETKEIFSEIWNSSKNSTIRADVFKQTFKLLCKAKDPLVADEIWGLLSSFIDKLTAEENRSIYITLSNAHMVPLPTKVMFWTKSYKYLKSLPEKANCTDLCRKLKARMNEILEFLDIDDAVEIFSKIFETKNSSNDDAGYLVNYMLCSRNEEIQMNRFRKVLLPILENALSSWNDRTTTNYCTRFEVIEMLKCFSREIKENVIDKNMIMPIELLRNILETLENVLSKNENYVVLTHLKLTLSCITIMNNIIDAKKNSARGDELSEKNKDTWSLLIKEATPEFANICMKYLREDVTEFYPSIYLLFSEALETLFRNFDVSDNDKLKIIQIFSEHDDFTEGLLLIFNLLPYYLGKKEKEIKLEILNKLCNHSSDEVKSHCWHYLEYRYKSL